MNNSSPAAQAVLPIFKSRHTKTYYKAVQERLAGKDNLETYLWLAPLNSEVKMMCYKALIKTGVFSCEELVGMMGKYEKNISYHCRCNIEDLC